MLIRWKQYLHEIQTYQAALASDKPLEPLPWTEQVPEHADNMFERVKRLEVASAFRSGVAANAADVPPEDTVRAYADEYIAFQQSRATKAGTFGNFRDRLNSCVAFLGPTFAASHISGVHLEEWYKTLRSEVDSGTYSNDYAAKLYASMRDFLKRLWQRHVIELPRNIADNKYAFPKKRTPKLLHRQPHNGEDVSDKAIAATKALLVRLEGSCPFYATA